VERAPGKILRNENFRLPPLAARKERRIAPLLVGFSAWKFRGQMS